MNEKWNLGTMRIAPEPEPSLGPPPFKASPAPKKESVLEVDPFHSNYRTRAALIEAHAAAFLKYTKLPPTDCELVEVREPGQTRWYFRAREK